MKNYNNDIDLDDDDDFKELLLDKRLSDIIKALQNSPKLDIEPILNSNKILIERFLSKLEEIKNNELPTPNVNVAAPNVNIDQSKVIASIEALSNEIINGLKSLQDSIDKMNEPKPKQVNNWEFEITERNINGMAKKITAKAK